MGCLIHKWDGCKCIKCGYIRDKNHAWYGCTCNKCGKVRDKEHIWSVHDDKYPSNFKVYIERCTCLMCGKYRDEHHIWKCGVCELCGKTSPLMGHKSGMRRLNGESVETYCDICKTLFKTESAYDLLNNVTRRIQDADRAGCTDSEAESILKWLNEQDT